MYNWWDTPSIFGEMRRAREEFDRLLRGPTGNPQGIYPAVNVFDDGENYCIKAEVPGLEKESLDIEATPDQLVIKGERPESSQEGVSCHRRERDSGIFNRSFRLPQKVDPSKVKASYKNGVLEIIVPRAPETKPRKVKIKA